MYSNIDNSILSKIDELRTKVALEKPDVIALNEIKPKNGRIPDPTTLNIPGYTLHLSDLDEPHTRGACIYVNNSFKSCSVSVPGHNFKDTISAKVTGKNNLNLLIQCLYRSGSPETALQHDDEMFKLLKETSLIPNYTKKIIVGDFNLNKISWSPDPSNPILPTHISDNSPEVKFLECIRDSFYTQHISEPTRYREGNKPTCDDLILSSCETDISEITYNGSIGKSDHITINCNINTNLKPETSKKTVYKYDKADFTTMKESFKVDWAEKFRNKTVQESMDIFEGVYKSAIDECVPKTELSGDERRKPIWMTHTALRKVRGKHSSWIRYLNTKQGSDYLQYIRKRNDAAHATKQARKEFEKSIAKACRTNPKGVWNYMKSTQKVKTKIPNLKKKDGSYTTCDAEIADVLNKQYFSVFTKENVTNIPSFPAKELLTEQLSNIDIEQEVVEKLLKNLLPNKAPGLDGLHPRILKEMADVISYPITEIFKKSFASGELPSKWLQAVITPIFKKGDRTDASNYRPVSLTSIICKTLEKIIVKHIINHLKSNHLNCKQQHGFSIGKSVTTNLLEALNVWTEALMHDIPIDILYMDYAKAFDTVPHLRLLCQVESFGITGNMLQWIKSFLSNRQQKVMANGTESSWSPVISGIPQGSIMGPVLFTLFVNDLPGKISSIISMFADDTKLYLPLTSDNSTDELVADLNYLQLWAEQMQMKFHPSKCKVMHLGKKNTRKDYVMMDGDNNPYTLEKTEVEKDLGVYIDSKLKFTHHCQEKVNKANKILGYIRHTFKYLNKDSFLLLYKSLVRPHLEFASCIWSPKHKYNIDLIERVQRRATKLIPQIKELSYSDRLKQLNLETLSYRRTRADLLETYRILTNQHQVNTDCHCSQCPSKSMLSPTLNTTTRGHSMKLQIQPSTGARQNFFSNRVCNIWNSFSEKTVSSKNVDIFKNNVLTEIGHTRFDFTFSY